METYKSQVTDLQNQIKTKGTEITTLQGKVGDTNALNQQIAQLQTDKTNLTNELNTKVTQIQKTHAIEGKIRDAKGKNVKAIMALLDQDKITYENGELGGIDDQLTTLASAEDSSMLFGETQTPPPAGLKLNNPASGGGTPATGKTFAEAIRGAIKTN